MQVLTNQLRKNKIRNMLRKQRQISFMSITIGGKLQIALPQQSNYVDFEYFNRDRRKKHNIHIWLSEKAKYIFYNRQTALLFLNPHFH